MSDKRATTIKLVDEGGRTLCVFTWQPPQGDRPEDVIIPGVPREMMPATPGRWMAQQKPPSKKANRHISAELNVGVSAPKHPTPVPVVFGNGAPVRLELPGLTLRWDRLTPILDKLAEHMTGGDTVSLTVSELRRCVS